MDVDDSADQSRHRRSDLVEKDEVEEGEFVPGSDDTRYVLQDRRDSVQGEARPDIKRRRIEGIVAVDRGSLPSPTPTPSCDCDCDSDGIDADDSGAAALAQQLLFPCPVCQREFRSKKAVCGHMRVHDLHGRHKERPLVAPAISNGWAVTGKRGSVGGRSVSPESQGVVASMAIVVSEPVMDPMPLAFASMSSNVEPNPPPINDDSMAIVVASSDDNPTNQVSVHPPCSPQFHEGHHQPAAPQVAVANPQPTVTQGQLAAAPPKIVTGLQLAAHQVQRAALPPPRDEQGWWVCKEEGCDKRYATHQGLGGHMAGHKNRENSEAAAVGLHLGVGGTSCAKPAKLHPCKHCPKVFTSGVQLGGHMRKHYEGKVIPKKRVSAGELASALALSVPMAPATMEAAAPVPEVAATVVLRIFGQNIVTVPPSEAASAVTETDQSSAASINNIHQ